MSGVFLLRRLMAGPEEETPQNGQEPPADTGSAPAPDPGTGAPSTGEESGGGSGGGAGNKAQEIMGDMVGKAQDTAQELLDKIPCE